MHSYILCACAHDVTVVKGSIAHVRCHGDFISLYALGEVVEIAKLAY